MGGSHTRHPNKTVTTKTKKCTHVLKMETQLLLGTVCSENTDLEKLCTQHWCRWLACHGMKPNSFRSSVVSNVGRAKLPALLFGWEQQCQMTLPIHWTGGPVLFVTTSIVKMQFLLWLLTPWRLELIRVELTLKRLKKLYPFLWNPRTWLQP